MLRSECRSQRAEAFQALHPKIVAVGLGIALAACSADVTRFSGPTFSLTGSTNRISSAPVPPESVWGNGGSHLADSAPYSGSSYGGSSYDSYAGGKPPYNQGRSYATHSPASQSYSGGYGAPTRGGYDSSRDTYSPPPASTPPQYAGNSYVGPQPRPTRAPSQYTYETQRRDERSRVAALTPSTTRDTYRPSSPSMSDYVPPIKSSADQAAAERSQTPDDPYLIEVQPGDTLIGIADRYNVSISELMTVNALNSPVLRPGRKLRLPKGANIAAGRRRTIPATPRETEIASLVSAPVDHEPAKVPPSSTPAAPPMTASEKQPVLGAAGPDAESGDAHSYTTYTMAPGDNLYRIAVEHGVSVAELQRLNNITDARKVRAGVVLKVPAPSNTTRKVASVEPAAPARVDARPVPAGNENGAALAPAQDQLPTKPIIINAEPKRVASKIEQGITPDVPPLTAAPSETGAESKPTPVEVDKASAEEQADGVGRFRWPVKGRIIAGFGKQADGSYSDGIKVAVPNGTPVHAAESGVVVYAGDELKGYGNLVLIRHDNGWTTAYAHNSELKVARGDRVRRGQVIAKAGNSGNAETPQLHFEVRQGATAVDPIPHLEKL